MRYFAFAAAMLGVVIGCAQQSDPSYSDSGDDTGDAGGVTPGGGKPSSGGAVSTGGGGKPSSGGAASSGGGGASGGKASAGAASTGGKGGTGAGGGGGKGNTAGAASTGGRGGTGAGGSGGASGSAGAGQAGSGAGGGCNTLAPAPVPGISARYVSEQKNATGTGIGSQLEILNQGQSTLNLPDLKLRYYLTNEVAATLTQGINWAWLRPTAGGSQVDIKTKVSFTVVPMTCTTATADTYLEFSFAADAGLLAPDHYVLFSWVANNAASQSFNQANDYSFNAGQAVADDDTQIVVRQGANTIWGSEP